MLKILTENIEKVNDKKEIQTFTITPIYDYITDLSITTPRMPTSTIPHRADRGEVELILTIITYYHNHESVFFVFFGLFYA